MCCSFALSAEDKESKKALLLLLVVLQSLVVVLQEQGERVVIVGGGERERGGRVVWENVNETRVFNIFYEAQHQFHKNYDSQFLLAQIYVDDIIFGATNEMLCEDFSKLMQTKFEISMMGELKFFLGL